MTKVVPVDDTREVYDEKLNIDAVEKSAIFVSDSSTGKGLPSSHPGEEPERFNETDDEKTKESRRKTCCTVLKGLLTRLLFVLHGVIASWRAAEVGGLLWWGLLGGVGLLFIESCVVLIARKGKEFKIFYPSVLIFLMTSVSAIWLLELSKFSRHNGFVNQTVTAVSRKTGSGLPFQIPIPLKEEEWLMALEQSLMILLIVARWLRPKGSLTREELSSLLLVYVGMAADIIDLFDIFNEKGVLKHYYFIFAVMGVWTWSLLQFVFVVSPSSSSPESPPTSADDKSEPDAKPRRAPVRQLCSNREMWSIVWSLVMQDAPFLAVRLIAIISFRVYTYSNFFFTFKNALVILLQTYRLLAITCWADDVDEDVKKKS